MYVGDIFETAIERKQQQELSIWKIISWVTGGILMVVLLYALVLTTLFVGTL